MTTTETASYPTRLHQARTALRTAEQQTAPLPAELVARLREFDAARYEQCEREVAAIAATIPALRATYDALEAQACGQCAGTGEYGGASRITRRGRKYCFGCNGTGRLSTI